MKLHQLAVATMIASASMAAHAEFTVSPMIGYTFYDREQGIEDDISGSIALGYRVTPNVGVELRYGQGRTEIDGVASKVRSQVGTLDAYYRFNVDGKLQPYVLVGGGQNHLKGYVGGGSASARRSVANVALGSFYQLSDNLALRGEARVIENLQDNLHDTVVSLGVTYGFGAQKAAVVAPAVIAAPAPAPAPVAAPKVLTETVSRDLQVLFDTNKAVIKAEHKAEIAEVAKLLNEYPTAKVEIQGHTDSTGPDRINNPLSQARADAVAAVLVNEFGIAADRITSKGYGSSQPVADNATAEGRAKNRRTVAHAEAEVKVTVK